MRKNDILRLSKAIGWTAFSVAGVMSGSIIGSVFCIVCAKDWWENVLKASNGKPL